MSHAPFALVPLLRPESNALSPAPAPKPEPEPEHKAYAPQPPQPPQPLEPRAELEKRVAARHATVIVEKLQNAEREQRRNERIEKFFDRMFEEALRECAAAGEERTLVVANVLPARPLPTCLYQLLSPLCYHNVKTCAYLDELRAFCGDDWITWSEASEICNNPSKWVRYRIRAFWDLDETRAFEWVPRDVKYTAAEVGALRGQLE